MAIHKQSPLVGSLREKGQHPVLEVCYIRIIWYVWECLEPLLITPVYDEHMSDMPTSDFATYVSKTNVDYTEYDIQTNCHK